MLVANNFHFENNCAILSLDGYPSGNAATVLVGDFLYSRAVQMMVAVGNLRVMQVLSNATNVIAERGADLIAQT